MVSKFTIASILGFFILCLPVKIIANTNPDSTGLPGDHLDLAAVLDLFKKSTTLEDFEKRLNSKDNHVNNLDLDGDDHVDYIRVVDNMKDKIHAIVLRVPINAKESQDVAVIELERKGDESAQLQIVGDEELYGEKYIVEPVDVKKADSTSGKWQEFAPQVIIVNVWSWPCVQYVYYPAYIVYVSPWYWMYWPYWWSPWHPYPYYMYYGWVHHHHYYYYCVDEYRMYEAHGYYGPRRVASASVHNRYEPAHERHKAAIKNKGQQGTPAKPKGDVQPQPQPPKPNAPNQPTPNKPDFQNTPPKPDVKPAPPKPDVQPAPPRPNTQPAPPKPNVQTPPPPRPKQTVQPSPTPRPKGTKPRWRNKKEK